MIISEPEKKPTEGNLSPERSTPPPNSKPETTNDDEKKLLTEINTIESDSNQQKTDVEKTVSDSKISNVDEIILEKSDITLTATSNLTKILEDAIKPFTKEETSKPSNEDIVNISDVNVDSKNTGLIKLIGQWKFCYSEMFEEFMMELGIGFFMRKLALLAQPNIKFIQHNESEWTIVTDWLTKSTHYKFKLDNEFDEVTADGRKVKSMFTLGADFDILIQTHRDPIDRRLICEIKREVLGDGTLKTTAKAGKIEATLWYEVDDSEIFS